MVFVSSLECIKSANPGIDATPPARMRISIPVVSLEE